MKALHTAEAGVFGQQLPVSRHGHQNYELYLIKPDGTGAQRVTYAEGFDGLPVFSADGKHLMWPSKRGGDGSQIFLARFRLPEGN